MNIQKQKIRFGKNEVGYFIAFVCLLACVLWVKGKPGFQLNVILKIAVYTTVLLLAVSIFLIKYFKCNTVRRSYFATLFLFSPFVIFPLYYSENTEILGIVFFFLGVEGILEKKNKWWIWWFSLAIGISEIYVLLFLAVILLLEKRIYHIIRMAIIPFFCGGAIYLVIHIFLNGWVNSGNIIWGEMIRKGFPAVAGQKASYLVLGVILILAICYFSEATTEKIYYYLMVLSTFFLMLGTFEDYYAAIIIPLLLLVFVRNETYFRINMILYLITNFCGMLCIIWNQDITLSKIPYIEYYMGAIDACFVAAVVLLWIVNYPGQKKFQNLAEIKCETWIKVLNLVIIYPLLLATKVMG